MLPDLEGKWRLVFSSGTLPAIQYIPVAEYIAVAGGLRSVALTSDIGPVHTECADADTYPEGMRPVCHVLGVSCRAAVVVVNDFMNTALPELMPR